MQNNITDLDEMKKILKYNGITYQDLKDYEIKLIFYEKVIESGTKLSLKQETDFFQCKKMKNNKELGVIKEKLKTPEEIMEENKLKAKQNIDHNIDPLKKFSDEDVKGDQLIDLLDSKYPSRELPTVEAKHPPIDEDDSNMDDIKDFENEFADEEKEFEEDDKDVKKKKVFSTKKNKQPKTKKETRSVQNSTIKDKKEPSEKSGKSPHRKRNLIILGSLVIFWIALTIYNHM